MDEKWPNYRGMAARYWMSHQYHLAFYFWCTRAEWCGVELTCRVEWSGVDPSRMTAPWQVTWLALCIHGALGKGTLHTYPSLRVPAPVFPQSYWTILIKQEFIIHNSVTRPVQYSMYTLPTMSTIYDKPGAGWDRINPDDYFISYFKTNEMGDVVQQEKIYNTTTVGRGSHYFDDNEAY